MVKQVGSDARKHFIKGIATDWATNPLTHGAYSAVKPGCVGAPEVLSEPIADKLFFAGEATGGNRSALVKGAYESGRKAANTTVHIEKPIIYFGRLTTIRQPFKIVVSITDIIKTRLGYKNWM